MAIIAELAHRPERKVLIYGVRLKIDTHPNLKLGTTTVGRSAYYDYPISTGPLEGTNNKIKTMKRQAYFFRDQEFFKLKILPLHVTRYTLVE